MNGSFDTAHHNFDRKVDRVTESLGGLQRLFTQAGRTTTAFGGFLASVVVLVEVCVHLHG